MTIRNPWRMSSLLLLLALPVMLFAAACGGDDDNDDSTATSAATTAAATTATETETAAATETATASATATADDGTPAAADDAGTAAVDIPASSDNVQGNIMAVDIRMGEHENADRIVFEFDGDNTPAVHVEYMDEALNCASGRPVAVEGEKVLSVTLEGTQGHDEEGQKTTVPIVEGPGQTIVMAFRSCDFEGTLAYGVGTTGEQPFKVTTLQNPSRVVIDVFK